MGFGRVGRLAVMAGMVGSLAACQAPNQNWANEAALKIGKPPENAAELRAAQSTRLRVREEQRVLAEVTQTLQDLGFNIEESAPAYGVLAGAKERDATEAGQIAGQVALTIALALIGAQYNPVWDTDQVIRVTVTTRPLPPEETHLRVSFERIVTNNQGFSRVELLTEADYAQGFHETVRQGLMLSGR